MGGVEGGRGCGREEGGLERGRGIGAGGGGGVLGDMVVNRESKTLIQQHFVDAGFDDLMIIPLRADKVFLRSEKGAAVHSIIEGAK